MSRCLPPDLAVLREQYHYNHKDGLFRHRHSYKRIKAGTVAGSTLANGYVLVCVRYKNYLAHRLAWYYYYGVWPPELDHKDRVRSNNRIKNLRVATRFQNSGNSKGWADKKKSGLPRGVYSYGENGRYVANIGFNYKTIHLGCFDAVNEAENAHNQAAKQLYGKFAK